MLLNKKSIAEIGHDLLVRTVVRLASDLEAELQASAKAFAADNEQRNPEANEFVAKAVGFIAHTMADQIKNEVLANETKKENNHD